MLNELRKKDKRRFPRISWNFLVKFRLKDAEDSKWLLSNIKNLSQGGCFFYSPVPFEPGQLLEIEIQFPRLTEPMRFNGEVRRKEGDKKRTASTYGIAVMFLEVEWNKKREFVEAINFFLNKK